MLSRIKNVIHIASAALAYIASGAGFLLFALVLLSSVMRYLFGAPFRFTEELVGLLFASMSFLALPMAFLQNRNIRLTLIVDKVPSGWQRIINVFSTIAMIAFCVILAYLMWVEAQFSLFLGAKSEISDIPLYPWMLVSPILLVLLTGVIAVTYFADSSEPDQSSSTEDQL